MADGEREREEGTRCAQQSCDVLGIAGGGVCAADWGQRDARRSAREYLDVLLPGQMAPDGSFPKELARTKPYSYSIFNFDAMTMLCCHCMERARIW